jgi:glyoxylase-like metal-dependent hydrolase (beta-lactamase superfamily II)
VDLQVIRTAVVPMPGAYAVRAGGGAVRRLAPVLRPGQDVIHAPCLAFVLRHPSAGVILVDTGFHADARGSLRRDLGLPMSVLFRGLEVAAEPFDVQLRAAGVEPADVRRVVMTHLHVDHTSGMRLLPNAEFVCAREEWAATRRRAAELKGYVARHLPDASRMRLVDLAREGELYGPFPHTRDLLGDGTIRLLGTPGHTPGHLSVLVDRGADGRVLLAGDAAYVRRNIDEQRLPLIVDDPPAARESLRRLAAFRAGEPDVPVVPSHDPDAWKALAPEPAGPGTAAGAAEPSPA